MSQINLCTSRTKGNTKRSFVARYRRWFCTLNNYNKEDVEIILRITKENNWKLMIGFHVGEKSHIPHIHFYIENKHVIMQTKLKKMCPKANLQKAKGTPEQIYVYLNKEKRTYKNFELKESDEDFKERLYKLNMEPYINVQWKNWQQDILDLIETKPDSRTIHWYWDEKGKIGKTFLFRYIAITIKGTVIITGNKRTDILHQMLTILLEKIIPKVVIINVPRHSLNFVNYTTIEIVKDSCFYSGKFDGGIVIIPYPHVIVFANEPPDINKMSEDRWTITELKD